MCKHVIATPDWHLCPSTPTLRLCTQIIQASLNHCTSISRQHFSSACSTGSALTYAWQVLLRQLAVLATQVFIIPCAVWDGSEQGLWIILCSGLNDTTSITRGVSFPGSLSSSQTTRSKTRKSFLVVFSRALLALQYKSLCDVVQLSVWFSVVGNTPPPRKHDFWADQVILSNFFFHKIKIFFQNFFPPKIFFHPKFFFTSKKIFPLSIFYAFLDVLCHPECSKFFLPKIFLGEARHDTMLPSISSFA